LNKKTLSEIGKLAESKHQKGTDKLYDKLILEDHVIALFKNWITHNGEYDVLALEYVNHYSWVYYEYKTRDSYKQKIKAYSQGYRFCTTSVNLPRNVYFHLKKAVYVTGDLYNVQDLCRRFKGENLENLLIPYKPKTY